MSTFELKHFNSDEEAVTYVALEGELDLTNVAEFEKRIDGACPPGRPLLVDLNRVVFVDSAALHGFFCLARTRGRSQLAFVIDPAAPIARALAIVDLASAAAVVATTDDALAAVDEARSA